MPVHRGIDSQGPYYQYGNHGKKYYYIPGNTYSREEAMKKAKIQGMAIHASKRSRF